MYMDRNVFERGFVIHKIASNKARLNKKLSTFIIETKRLLLSDHIMFFKS